MQAYLPMFRHARGRQAERATDPDGYRDVDAAFKIPKVIPLATLLDSHSRGRDAGAVNEPDMVGSVRKKKMKKGKRRLKL